MKNPLTTKVKLSYGVGDFAANILFQVITILYMIYLTNHLGIPAHIAGVILMISKLWDAVTDPIMGSIIDKTRSRWGAKRVYLLFGAIPLGASFALLFWNPGLSPEAAIPYALLTYMLFCTAYTVVNIPYASLTVSITHDYHERTVLTRWRMTFALLGTLLAAVVGPLLLNGLGYFQGAVVFGVLAALITLWTFLGVREVHREPGQVKLLANIKSVFQNIPYLILFAGTFFLIMAINVMAGIVVYYFNYVLLLPGQEAIGLGIIFGSAILYLPLLSYISRRHGKKEAYLFSMAAFVLGLILLYFTGSSLDTARPTFLIMGIGVSGVFLMPWSMVADTIEYSELKTGNRPEGPIYGYFGFMMKAGAASAASLYGFWLTASGYQETTGGQIIAQSVQAVEGIRVLLTLVPAGLIILGSLILIAYPISREYHARMTAEIEARKASAKA